MNEQAKRYEEPSEVDLERLLTAIWHRLWIILLTIVLSVAIAYAGARYLATPMYRSSVMIYVNNRNISVDGMVAAFTSDDIRAARGMVDTYVVILYARQTLEEVINQAEITGSTDEIREMLEVEVAEMIETEIVNGTEIFRVAVTGPDPDEAERIANAIASVLPWRIADIIDGTSARIVDAAVAPSRPFSPDVPNSLLLGGLFGIALGVATIVLRELYDDRIRSERDLGRFDGIPLLASIPDMNDEKKA